MLTSFITTTYGYKRYRTRCFQVRKNYLTIVCICLNLQV